MTAPRRLPAHPREPTDCDVGDALDHHPGAVTVGRSKRAPQQARRRTGGELQSMLSALGWEVRRHRKRSGLTATRLAERAGLSVSMLSILENGLASPSLATLKALSRALDVPVIAFFRSLGEVHSASFVEAGCGLTIGGSVDQYTRQLLGQLPRSRLVVVPYLVTIESAVESFPVIQHPETEFIYMLAGEMIYRHGDASYRLQPGDSLCFDSSVVHGPEELTRPPVRYLAVASYVRTI